ncbi:MAG: DUF1566 domain-containing protein [Rhodanobacter sp.]
MSLMQITQIKIGKNGEQLPDDATEWDALYIPEYGRMWSADNVGDGRMNDVDATAACKALTLGGFTDWYEWSREEALAIVDLTKFNPAVDERFLRNIKTDYWYRTSTEIAGSSDLVWGVYFSYGNVYNYNRYHRGLVRACRRVSPAGQ